MAKGRKTGGRKPGSQNKFTGALKEMILQALSNVGGVSYLEAQAAENPVAFMALVGKTLPIVGGEGKGRIVVEWLNE